MGLCSCIVLFIPSFSLVLYAIVVIYSTCVFTKTHNKILRFFFSLMYFLKLMRQTINFTCFFAIYSVLHCFLKIWITYLVSFPFSLKNFLYHSWSTDLLVMSSLSCHLSEKVFISPSCLVFFGYVCWSTI